MKIRFLFSDYKPAFKCGADPVTVGIGAAALGGLNLAGQALQADQSSSNVRKQLQAQAEENQKNRDWQTQQAEIARQWEAGQVLQQNQFTREQAGIQNQYNLNAMKQQAMYNSPVYQKQQLLAAGINPQVYFGQNSSFSGSSAQTGGASGTPSAGSASGVGSVQGLNPVGFQPTNLQIPAFISSLGSMMSGLADAKKSGVETSFLEKSFESRLKEAVAKGDMAETVAALQQLDLAFQKANFNTKLKQAYVNYKETLTNIDLLSEKKLTEQEEQKLKQATVAMNKAIQELNEQEKNRLGVVVQFLPRMLESEILANRGSAAAGFAKAVESRSSAELNRFELLVRRNVQADIEDTYLEELNKLRNENAISQEQLEIARATKRIQETAADHAEALFWKDFFLDIVTQGTNAFTSIRNSRSWENLSDASQRRVDARLKEIENQYGDKVEITTPNSRGGTTRKTYHRPYQKYGSSRD